MFVCKQIENSPVSGAFVLSLHTITRIIRSSHARWNQNIKKTGTKKFNKGVKLDP